MIRNPMWIILIYILLLGGTINCAEAPPSTPDALEELLGFTFEHMRDEDTTELVLSVEKLYLWFQDSDQLESAREGFTIDNLNSSAVTSLDEKERNTEGLQGVSVVT